MCVSTHSLLVTWVPAPYGSAATVPINVPSVWCFQYTNANDASIELKCIPAQVVSYSAATCPE